MIRPGILIRGKITPTIDLKGKTNASIIREYPELENVEIKPTTEEQILKSEKYGFDEVKILGVTAEIDENIKSENIKEGTTILGVEGGYKGVDTSDATATVDDIASGKTAYVNGEKIEGTVETITGSKPMSAEKVFDFGGSVAVEAINEKPVLFKKSSKMLVAANYNKFVEAIKLTSDKIVEGNTILGVSGSVKIPDTSDATALAEDILQDKTAYVNNEKITGTMQEYDGSYTGNGETGNEWEAIFASSIDGSLGANVTKLPSGITTIGSYAFRENSKLALKELPETIRTIGAHAFYGCTNLALTKLPSELKSLGIYSFSGCTKLSFSEIPINVTTLPSFCFNKCSGLTSITILGNITEFAGQVFYQASNLEKIVLPNITSVPVMGSNVFSNTKISYREGYIYVPDTLVDSFKSATNWSAYASQIKPISELEG